MRLPILAGCIVWILSFGSGTWSQTVSKDSDPVVVGSVNYSMPQSAIDAEIDGTVLVGIGIDETGRPTKAVLLAGPRWPCGRTLTNAIKDMASTLSDTMMKLRFSPAIKDGQPVAPDIGMTLILKNPKLGTEPLEIDDRTAEQKAKNAAAGVVVGRARSLPKPAYPPAAKTNRDGGTVVVLIVIDDNGKVLRAGALNGAPTLQSPARGAACAAKFEPMLFNGVKIKVSAIATYYFSP